MVSLSIFQLVLSALSGAVGAFLLRFFLRLHLRSRESKKPLAVYYCGEESPTPGGLDHGWGRGLEEKGPPKRNVWLFTKKRIKEGDRREHTIFGPYVNDLGRPGDYRVTFLVYASAFTPSLANKSVLLLDVVQAPFGGTTNYVLHGQRLIKENELARCRGQYISFDIGFYASGTGVYEYRARVFENNVVDIENGDTTDPEIRFDTISVFRNPPLWDVI
jgi:hypothetical protein